MLVLHVCGVCARADELDARQGCDPLSVAAGVLFIHVQGVYLSRGQVRCWLFV